MQPASSDRGVPRASLDGRRVCYQISLAFPREAPEQPLHRDGFQSGDSDDTFRDELNRNARSDRLWPVQSPYPRSPLHGRESIETPPQAGYPRSR